jgi:hypothetical protein
VTVAGDAAFEVIPEAAWDACAWQEPVPISGECHDCGGDAESYDVADDVWRAAWPDGFPACRATKEKLWHNVMHGMYIDLQPSQLCGCLIYLCFDCLGARLGRPLCPDDFTGAPINDWLEGDHD